ncbi:MAG: energy transducer TonB [Gammaproteobacteria bacterium]|nr:energy transducer TonB [Gammaproteobacteria bacterium]
MRFLFALLFATATTCAHAAGIMVSPSPTLEEAWEEARRAGVKEGHVVVAYTITETCEPIFRGIVESQPVGLFDAAAEESFAGFIGYETDESAAQIASLGDMKNAKYWPRNKIKWIRGGPGFFIGCVANKRGEIIDIRFRGEPPEALSDLISRISNGEVKFSGITKPLTFRVDFKRD